MSTDTPIINPVVKAMQDNILTNMDALHTEPSVTTPDLLAFYEFLESTCHAQAHTLHVELIKARRS